MRNFKGSYRALLYGDIGISDIAEERMRQSPVIVSGESAALTLTS